MIRLQNISMEYGHELFNNISCTLGNNEKVGLVGRNGVGKSTLLNIIAGREIPTTGSIETTNEKIVYLPQIIHLDPHNEFDYIGEYLEDIVADEPTELWKVRKLQSQLSLTLNDFTHLHQVSPGQRMKLFLIKLMMQEPTILLCDEPTNHLDITGIEWFEYFIKKVFHGISLIVSHDRALLDSVTTHTFEIDEKQLHIYEGNYTAYVQEKEHRLAERAKQVELQQRKKAQFEDNIERIKRQFAGKRQSKALKAMRTRMEREVTRNEIQKYEKSSITGLQIEGEVHRKKRILQITDLTFGYTKENKLFETASLEIFGSERIWIRGANGIGKSTLIKLLTGKISPQKGAISWGNNISWAYFSQEHGENFAAKETVQNYFCKQTGTSFQASFGALSQFMFDKELMQITVTRLSPGQKARLQFAIFAQFAYECLILDEPTNHLDIETKETIEQSLREYQGTILLVSHDRYFAEQVQPTQELHIENKKLVWK